MNHKVGFAEITGQQRVIRLLRQALTQHHLPHAFLFTGVEGVGKRSTALVLAKAVNCDNGDGADSCGHCLSCRKAASGNHPDIFTIKRDGPFIKIEQIRALQRRLRFRPLEARFRVIIVEDAQNMKAEAANALLKVLEEPPAGNLIILTATDTTALLPTIVSRCLHLPFQPLATAEIADYLRRERGVTPEQADVIAGLAGGSLSRAATLLDEEQLARRRWLLEIVAKVHKSQVTDLLAAAQLWQGENEDLKKDLEWLKTWTRDLLVQHMKAVDRNGLINGDFAEEVTEVAQEFRPDHLLEMFELICTVQGAISYNINKRLSLEALLLFLHTRAVKGVADSGALQPIARDRYNLRKLYG